MKNKTMRGGAIVGAGAFGCVFSPALKCRKKTKTTRKKSYDPKKFVSKMLINEAVQEELNDNSIIIDIIKRSKKRKFNKYLPLLHQDICNDFVIERHDIQTDGKPNTEQTNLATCKNVYGFRINKLSKPENITDVNNPALRNFKVVTYPNAGVDLFYYLNHNSKKNDINASLTMFRNLCGELHKLYKNCIFELNNLGIVHGDIKLENVTINPETNSLNLIDFGRSIIHNDNHSIPSRFTSSRLDFNMPIAVVLFNMPDKIDFSILNEHVIYQILEYNNDTPNTGLLYSILQNVYRRVSGVTDLRQVLLDIAENLKITIQDKNITEDSKHEYYHDVVKPNIDLWGCLLNYYDIFDMILQRHIGDDTVFNIQTKLFNTMFNFIKNSMNKPINKKQFLKDLTEIAK
jgi:serine/threonine protein kinase